MHVRGETGSGSLFRSKISGHNTGHTSGLRSAGKAGVLARGSASPSLRQIKQTPAQAGVFYWLKISGWTRIGTHPARVLPHPIRYVTGAGRFANACREICRHPGVCACPSGRCARATCSPHVCERLRWPQRCTSLDPGACGEGVRSPGSGHLDYRRLIGRLQSWLTSPPPNRNVRLNC